jgi:dihydrofolate reductase
MARLVFSMLQSLDGYVDHMAFAPGPNLFRHFIKEAERQVASVYGRRMHEIMRYWDEDHDDWEADGAAFAAAWRRQKKWVVSRTLKPGDGSLGRNAELVTGDLAAAMRELKAGREGDIEVAGPDLAGTLTKLGLIDEYQIYLFPAVLGGGTPYFAAARPPLKLVSHERMDGDVLRLRYAPA